MIVDLRKTGLPGFVELLPRVHRDERGAFVKVFHRERFAALGLPTEWAEEYWSVSEAGVVRGFHFQIPPHQHHKLVYCTAGAVMDVAVDLRVGSPTEGEHRAVTLSAEAGNAVLLAPGLAHGFCVTDGPAVLVYRVTSVYAPEHDTGVRWDSAGVAWPEAEPVVSERDRSFPALADFESPFRWKSEAPGEGRAPNGGETGAERTAEDGGSEAGESGG